MDDDATSLLTLIFQSINIAVEKSETEATKKEGIRGCTV
ncbi:hypothetical protein kam1_1799 [Methylacidiphilum kamchatkense Kam1]|uniref:Uncharacterized protein n=1 Tax=Methylacidiphilum kamchatkense Kam1 TaxID=1202785 RepID=A0A516TP43_9BACT|nr:hypothetical protein kam1_1799 [Methylacidiphilum kamchatkense Kam1]